MNPPAAPVDLRCQRCGTQLAPTMLACPACGWLVHSRRLTELAKEAEASAGRGDLVGALTRWREALELLPELSRQREIVADKVNALSSQVHAGIPAGARQSANADPGKRGARAGAKGTLVGIGALALLLWKFKFVLTFVLTKGKLLLLGLTKASTLFSMVLSLGVYWSVWGWKFALGLVLSIYVHEMGHVVALTRYGFQATAPMFIPGVGAVIRSRQHPTNRKEDAAIGLAGPIYGLGAAVAAYAIWLVSGRSIFAAIAEVGAWINLFNLLPIVPLDGGRAFNAMSRNQRWLAVASLFIAWFYTAEGLLPLLAIVALLRAVSGKPDERGDAQATAQYIGLVAVLSLMCLIPVDI